MISLALSLLLACSPGKDSGDGVIDTGSNGDGGAETETETDTDTDSDADADTDTDTDADADTDVDTDADTDVDTDTDTDVDRSGDYRGTVWIEGIERTLLIGDTCSGDLVLRITTDGDPDILGGAACTFEGLLAEAGEQDAAFDGEVLSGGLAEGRVTVELLGEDVNEPWTGSFEGETLRGSMSGSTSFTWKGLDLTVDWTGGFEVTR